MRRPAWVLGLLLFALFPRNARAACDALCDAVREEPTATPPLACTKVSVGFKSCGCDWHFMVENGCKQSLQLLDLPLQSCGNLHPGPEGCTTVEPGDRGARSFLIQANGRIERVIHLRDDDGDHEVHVALTVSNYHLPGCQMARRSAPAWPVGTLVVPLIVLGVRARRRRGNRLAGVRSSARGRWLPPRALRFIGRLFALVPALLGCEPDYEPQGDDSSAKPVPGPEAVCKAPCRVVSTGLKHPWEIAAQGDFVYVIDRADHGQAQLTTIPSNGGNAAVLATMQDPFGLELNGSQCFWTELALPGSGSTVVRVPLQAATPTNLFESSETIGPIAVDDVTVYASTSSELLAIAIADGSSRTLASPWAVSDLALGANTLYLVDRGTRPPPEMLADPDAKFPCLVESVPSAGGAAVTLFAAESQTLADFCSPSGVEPLGAGVAWAQTSADSAHTLVSRLATGEQVPTELGSADGIFSGLLVGAESWLYLVTRAVEGEKSTIVGITEGGEQRILWTGDVHIWGLAVDGSSVYFTVFTTQNDVARGAVLAVPR